MPATKRTQQVVLRESLLRDARSYVKGYLNDFFNNPTADNHAKVVSTLQEYERDFKVFDKFSKESLSSVIKRREATK